MNEKFSMTVARRGQRSLAPAFSLLLAFWFVGARTADAAVAVGAGLVVREKIDGDAHGDFIL